MNSPAVLRCAIYTRKSSAGGLEQEFNSLHAQREACEAYVKSQAGEGWELSETSYDDGGFSGGSMERPAVQKLLNDIESSGIDIVVVYKVDRLTRSLIDFAKIVETFESNNVSFVSVTQAFNSTTSMGRLTLNVLLSFAQFEREVTGERIRDKIAASKKKGMWMGGNPPLGYDVLDRKLVVNDEEAIRVRMIFERYLDLGSVTALAGELRKHRIRSKSWRTQKGNHKGGSYFSRGALYSLLRNRSYLGEVVHRGEAYAGEHKGIVERALWERVQGMLDAHRRKLPKSPSEASRSLLGGLLFDDRDNPMSPTHSKKQSGRRYRYYVSQALIRREHNEAGSIQRVPAQEIEVLITRRVMSLLPETELESWERLEPSGQAEWIRSIVNRVEIDALEARLTLSKVALGIHVESGFSEQFFDDHTTEKGDSLIVRIPVRFQTHRGERTILAPSANGSSPTPHLDKHLIKAVARAHSWREALVTGKAESVNELVRNSRFSKRYIRRLLPLAFLSPDITEAILQGTQPPHLKLVDLLDRHLPLSWEKQREMAGVHKRQ
jgi:DNA invertase Pin-like site-specific DNA recombinase